MKAMEEDLYEYILNSAGSKFVKLATKQSGCFRTEIRSTGTFICGIHQLEEWKDSWIECPDLIAMAGIMEYALYEVGDDYLVAQSQRNS